ncbi:TPA: hypothetical protein DCW61_01085 [Candidatus Uhrbacteria bacterium]|nr:hypothetical protein [Candidatus Uhrbacteria bacterium]
MSNILILFTKKYPYGNGEEFIQAELGFHLSSFNRIIVVSCQADKSSKKTKITPSNIQIAKIVGDNTRFRYLRYFLLGLKFINDTDLNEELKSANTFKSKVAAIYYYGKMQKIFTSCVSVLKNLKLDSQDNIVLYSYWFFDITHVAILLKKKFFADYKCSVVTRAHGFDLYEYRSPSNNIPFRKWCLKNIDEVFTCSIDGSNYLKIMYPDFSNKISVSYLGTNDFGMAEFSKGSSFHLVTCSWLAPLKRVDLVASALKTLIDKGVTNIHWTCIGTGTLLKKLKNYSKRNLANISVDFLGQLSNSNVHNFYAHNNIDVFLNVSSTEGLPVSIMEAQSYGIPSIATDVGGTREIVINNCTGRIVPADLTPSQLAVEIQNWINIASDENFKIRINCRKFWETHFNSSINYLAFSQQIQNKTKR